MIVPTAAAPALSLLNRAPLPVGATGCNTQQTMTANQSPCATDYQRDFALYYSLLRFAFVKSGAGPYAYTLTARRGKFFDYGIGDIVGGTSVQTATRAETNLLTRRQTNNNEKVWIRGLALQVVDGEAAKLARALFRNSHLELVWAGAESGVNLGRPEAYPGGPGLFGLDVDGFTPSTLIGEQAIRGHVTNGAPGIDNYKRIGGGILWLPISAQGAYSQLTIDLCVDRDVVVSAPAARAADAPVSGDGFQGVTAWDPPADGVSIDLVLTLLGTVYGAEPIAGQVQAIG